MQQIWGRLRRLVRSGEIGKVFGREREDGSAALYLAEELIRETSERDHREELRKFESLLSSSSETKETKREKQGGGRLKETDAYAAACRLLGVSPNASFAEIVGAYRAAIALHHPDRNGANGEAALREATSRAQEFNRAFEIVRQYHNR